jgi:hypothetical protein
VYRQLKYGLDMPITTLADRQRREIAGDGAIQAAMAVAFVAMINGIRATTFVPLRGWLSIVILPPRRFVLRCILVNPYPD